MENLENEVIKGIHASRYIMSWYNAGGAKGKTGFVSWLRQLRINGEPLTELEIRRIRHMQVNGKLELEMNAREFISEQSKKEEA